ncbi:thiamine pyrophosphate-dependent enzyme [Cupriavidus sp. CP313]
MSEAQKAVLNRRTAIARILKHRGDALVVTSLGNPTYDVASTGDCAGNFYLWGAMGGSVMVGLGIARAQPERRVVVVTGDGEMMMGIGSLATAAVDKPRNLAVIVIDNEHYAETGMQPAHAGRGVDITGVARAVGFDNARTVRTEQELAVLAEELFSTEGLLLATVKVTTEPVPAVLPPRDGPFLRSRFREALLGSDAHK